MNSELTALLLHTRNLDYSIALEQCTDKYNHAFLHDPKKIGLGARVLITMASQRRMRFRFWYCMVIRVLIKGAFGDRMSRRKAKSDHIRYLDFQLLCSRLSLDQHATKPLEFYAVFCLPSLPTLSPSRDSVARQMPYVTLLKTSRCRVC